MKGNRWKGCWLAVFLIHIICVVSFANDANNLPAGEVFDITVHDIIEKLPGKVISDSKEVFSRKDNLIVLMLAGGAGMAMDKSGADDSIAGNFERHGGFEEFLDRGLDFTGGPGAHFGATALWYMISVGNRDDFNQQRAWTMLSALSITGLVTTGLKAAVNNDTPNGKSWAWPSGHTASSFTVASVLDEYYGPKVGIPAYIFASCVGWRMMDTGDHWASDVLFGVTLGWVVGHTVAGKHKELEVAGFKVYPGVPLNNGSVAGVSLVKRF